MAHQCNIGNRKARRRAQALARKATAVPNSQCAEAKQTSSAMPQWRAALLSTAAAGALLVAQPHAARAQVVINAPGTGPCVTIGTTANCTGNLIGGLNVTGPSIETLNVNSLTGNIAPALNVDGINFTTTSGNSITINSDTTDGPGGPFSIITTGLGKGIYAGINGDGNITITSTGDINSGFVGIEGYVDGTGAISITSTGRIQAGSVGILATIIDGDITVTSTGDITSGDEGINADVDGDGNITINSMGNINSGDEGIDTYVGGDGNITIISKGNIVSGDEGIEADIDGDGNVVVVSKGNITTTGNNDEGINIDVYGTGNVTITSTGNISTTGDDATGIEGYTYDGAVRVTSTGNITTRGDDADAISAYTYNGSAIVRSTGNIVTRGDDSRGIFAYGFNGNVSVTASGSIRTTGDNAYGIYAVQGGTGNTNIVSSSNITTSGFNAYGIHAFGDGSGNISITSTGNITTTGTYADGIFGLHNASGNVSIMSSGDVSAQGIRAFGIAGASYGGNVSITSTGNISTAGDIGYGIIGVTGPGGGTITIVSTGDIMTTGDGADGILAYSYGGPVSVTVGGNVKTTGTDSDGIDVNNSVGAGNSTVTVLAGSTVTGGTGGGDGIDFQDGNVNRVFNFGTIRTLGENAIEGEGSGRELIFNFGTVTGNVDLGPGANAFNNQAGGLFNSGANVNLGAGNLLTNAGTLAPGSVGTVGTTALTGNLVQTGSGTFATDLNLTSLTNDRVNVTGTAKLEGSVKVSVQNPALITQQFTILSAAGGTTDNGLGLIASPALNAQLLYPNATDVVLGIRVDFSTGGLNMNQTSIGNNLNLILGAGGGGLAPIYSALLNGIFTLPDYANALDQLSPEVFLNTETATLFAAEEFTNNLFSCQTAGGPNAGIAEGQCVWVRPEGRFLNRDRTSEHIGFEEDAGSFSAGAQVAVAPGWFAGGGIGFETATLNTDTGAHSESNRFNIGGAVKYQSGPLLIAAAISGGIADFETDRTLNFGGFSAKAHSEHDVTYLAGQIRAAYLVPFGNWYAKPLIDLNVTRLDRDGVSETGGGAANLVVDSGDDTFFSVLPAVEFGGEFTLGNGSIVRPYVKAGVAVFEDDGHALTARFAGAPAGVGGFAINTQFDDVFADIEAGVSIFSTAGATLTMSYEGRISDDTGQHGFFLKGSSRF